MTPAFVLACIVGYFGFLLLIARITSRNATSASYFLGNKASPWIAVAFGLIGDSLSGVTFISVPGQVGTNQFSYLQIVMGYVLGYVVIAHVLLPLYYRLNLTSIYTYLRGRFGPASQKAGSFFFLLSRTGGAAARLFLAASVIHPFLFDRWLLWDRWKVPFWATVTTIILLILIYTLKGGIKTLVWTDTFQSSLLLLGVALSIVAIAGELNLGFGEMIATLRQSEHTRVFFWDWQDPKYFWKQFLSGAFIAIVMTGLDQNMMQKNLSCRSLREAQKNIYAFTAVMFLVNLLFLSLGALLHVYAQDKTISVPQNTDQLFPMLALQHLGHFAAVVFLVGLTAATFSSADSVLTTLTTSFCIDFLEIDRRPAMSEVQRIGVRRRAHFGFAAVLLLVILGFEALNSQAVITAVLTLAGYTYGPLLGLFAFGLIHRRAVRDRLVPVICVLSPAVCYVLDANSQAWFKGYRFGFELLMLNGLLTYLGLWVIARTDEADHEMHERHENPASWS
ncbi:MAG: sodium:solute symporter [Verrucomicrobia bacterium]|nr:sodium:solute symporter [Verrucomicrobiota bacterium]